MYQHGGCQAGRNDRSITQINLLRKIINTIAQQLKKRRNSMCYKHSATATCFFMSSNRRIASFQFFMLDGVELNHNGEQYIFLQNERNSIHFTSSEQ